MIRGQRGPLHRTRRWQRCVQGPSRTISPPSAREALPGPGAARTAARRRDRSSPRALRVGLPHTHVGLVGRSPDANLSASRVIRARLQALFGIWSAPQARFAGERCDNAEEADAQPRQRAAGNERTPARERVLQHRAQKTHADRVLRAGHALAFFMYKRSKVRFASHCGKFLRS